MTRCRRLILALLALPVILPAGAQTLYALGGSTAGPGTTLSLYTIDTATWTASVIGSNGVSDLLGLAIHPTSGEIYSTGGTANGTTVGLYRIDPATGAASYVGGNGKFVALDFAPDGTLYAHGSADATFPTTGDEDDLYTIDLDTGAHTVVGDLAHEHMQGIAFANDGSRIFKSDAAGLSSLDPATAAETDIAFWPGSSAFRLAMSPAGVLYGNGSAAGSRIYRVDPNSAQTTLLGDTGIRIQGLAFSPPPPQGPSGFSTVGIPVLTPAGLALAVLAMAFIGARRLRRGSSRS